MARTRPALSSADLRLLGRSLVFRTIAPALRQKLIRAAELVTVPPGTVLWRRDSRARHVYILLAGRIGLLDEPEETVIDLLPPGSMLGSASVLSEQAFMFSARTVDPLRALRVPAPVFRALLRREPTLLLAATLETLHHVRRLLVAVRDLKQRSANQRLARYLVLLAGRARGPVTVRLTEDLDLMARILGITRESLSRSFAQLRAQGVRKRAKLVSIANVARLRAFSAGVGHAAQHG